ALDLHSGCLGNAQLDLALERLDLPERGDRRLLQDLALSVTRVGAQAEPDLRLVALVETDEVPGEPRRGPEQDEQEPARERIERARVPRLDAEARAQLADDGERRRADRLVDQDEPLHGGNLT